MHKFKTFTAGVAVTLLLAFAPFAHAQSAKDLDTMQTFLDIMTSYFNIIESTYDVSSDAEKAAIMQMQKIKEVYEDKGEKSRVTTVLREVLKQSHSPAIRNAAYMILGDTLKETGQADQAIELLRQGLNENIKATQ